jgi:hypothetical protein
MMDGGTGMDGQQTADPAEIRTEVRRLRTRSRRRAHGGAWLPAVALAGLLLLSAVLYRYPVATPNAFEVDYPFWAGLPDEQRSAPGSYLYWLLGLPVVIAVIAVWYRGRARRVGVRVPWRVLAGAGLGALVLLLVLVAVPSRSLPAVDLLASGRPPWWHGFATPLLAVAVSVVALAWAERSLGFAAAGLWIGLLAWWQCTAGLVGALPDWVTWLLDAGQDPGRNAQLAVRPASMLLVMALPLLLCAVVQALRVRAARHAR